MHGQFLLGHLINLISYTKHISKPLHCRVGNLL